MLTEGGIASIERSLTERGIVAVSEEKTLQQELTSFFVTPQSLSTKAANENVRERKRRREAALENLEAVEMYMMNPSDLTTQDREEQNKLARMGECGCGGTCGITRLDFFQPKPLCGEDHAGISDKCAIQSMLIGLAKYYDPNEGQPVFLPT